MVVADDNDKVPAPAGDVPAGETAEKPPTEPAAEPEGAEPEGEQAATEATPDETVGEVSDEQDDDADEGETPQEKKSRLQRYRDQAERLKAENEQLRARSRTELPSDVQQLQRALDLKVLEEIGPPPDPNDVRFKDDYVGFNNARQAWEMDRRQVSRAVRKEFATAIQHEQEHVANLVSEHKERVERFKKKAPDYDAVMARATMPVALHVERLLLQSKKSEQLGYVLAKDQMRLSRLNRMSPEDAAREIGRLEGRLSLPAQQKTQTQARKPITPLKGSGAASPQGLAAVNAWMKKTYGTR